MRGAHLAEGVRAVEAVRVRVRARRRGGRRAWPGARACSAARPLAASTSVGLVVLHGPVTVASARRPVGSRFAAGRTVGDAGSRRPGGRPRPPRQHDDTVTALACRPEPAGGGRRRRRRSAALVATIGVIGAAAPRRPTPGPDRRARDRSRRASRSRSRATSIRPCRPRRSRPRPTPAPAPRLAPRRHARHDRARPQRRLVRAARRPARQYPMSRRCGRPGRRPPSCTASPSAGVLGRRPGDRQRHVGRPARRPGRRLDRAASAAQRRRGRSSSSARSCRRRQARRHRAADVDRAGRPASASCARPASLIYGYQSDQAVIDARSPASGLARSDVRIGHRAGTRTTPTTRSAWPRPRRSSASSRTVPTGGGNVSIDPAWQQANLRPHGLSPAIPIVATLPPTIVARPPGARSTRSPPPGWPAPSTSPTPTRYGGCFGPARFSRIGGDDGRLPVPAHLGHGARHEHRQQLPGLRAARWTAASCGSSASTGSRGAATSSTPDGMHFEWVGERPQTRSATRRRLLPEPVAAAAGARAQSERRRRRRRCGAGERDVRRRQLDAPTPTRREPGGHGSSLRP